MTYRETDSLQTQTSCTGAVSVCRHQLFPEQYLIACHSQSSGLKIYLFHTAYNNTKERHELTCTVTASEVTTTWRDIYLLIRLHQMHDMQTIVIDVRGGCLSVCLSAMQLTRLHCAKMAEPIKMPFGVNTPGGRCNIVLDRGPYLPLWGKGKIFQDPFISPE